MSNTAQVPPDAPGVPHTLVERPTTIIRRIPLTLICEPLKPMRHNMDDEKMQELMDGIRREGLLQNLCVVPIRDGARVEIVDPSEVKMRAHEAADGTYRVAAGHRRLLACRAIFLDAVTCKVFCDPAQTEDAIMNAENVHREDPTDFDLAVQYVAWSQEEGITEKEMCARAGKSITFIYARMELLQGWKDVCDALHKREINFAVARALNREEDEEYMKMFLRMAIDQGATQRLVSAWVNEHAAHKAMAQPAMPAPAPNVSVTTPANQKIECLLCGDNQSYNLRTVMLCVSDVDRIKEARAAAERQEECDSAQDATPH